MKSQALGGVMFWSIDLDDFTGNFCNQGKYPLLNLINTQLKSANVITPSTPLPSATVTVPTTTAQIVTGISTPSASKWFIMNNRLNILTVEKSFKVRHIKFFVSTQIGPSIETTTKLDSPLRISMQLCAHI